MPNTRIDYIEATFDGAGLTGEIDFKGGTLVGIETPANMAGTSLTFQHKKSDGTGYLAYRDAANAPIAVTIDNTAAVHSCNPSTFAGFKIGKINSGQAGNSGKKLNLLVRPV